GRRVAPGPACGERSARSRAPGEGDSQRVRTCGKGPSSRPSPRKRGEGEEAPRQMRLPCSQGEGEKLAAPPPNKRSFRTGATIGLLIAATLLRTPAFAAETVIAGGVSSGSTNLWPIHIG